MKVVSYNILQGAVDARGSRIDKVLELLLPIAPDFLALQEANRFDVDESNTMQLFRDRLNLPYAALSRGALYEDGQRYHVASLSRYPIENIETFANGRFQSAALTTEILGPLGSISITNLHLHDSREAARLDEIHQVLQHLGSGKHELVLGDFNAISRLDNYQLENLECEARFEVTDLMSKHFTDIFGSSNNIGFTHPTAINLDRRFTRPRRIDYCFASARLASSASHCRVITEDPANQASDHFPIMVEFASP